jgi:hypothetical protein
MENDLNTIVAATVLTSSNKSHIQSNNSDIATIVATVLTMDSDIHTIYWIRHGYSAANEAYYGQKTPIKRQIGRIKKMFMLDPLLSESGMDQSEINADFHSDALKELSGSIPIVFCSAMSRAILTARLMFPESKIIVCPFLIEEGQTCDNKIPESITEQHNKINESITKQQNKIHKSTTEQQNKINKDDNKDGKIDYQYVKMGMTDKFSKDASKSNIPEFLTWLGGKVELKDKIKLQNNQIPIVAHSNLITKYIKDIFYVKHKMFNNQAIKIEYKYRDKNYEELINKKAPQEYICLYSKGCNNKKGNKKGTNDDGAGADARCDDSDNANTTINKCD